MRERLRRGALNLLFVAGSLALAGCNGESVAAASQASSCPKPISVDAYNVSISAEDCYPKRLRLTHAGVNLSDYFTTKDFTGALNFVRNHCLVMGSNPNISQDHRTRLFYIIANVQEQDCLVRLAKVINPQAS